MSRLVLTPAALALLGAAAFVACTSLESGSALIDGVARDSGTDYLDGGDDDRDAEDARDDAGEPSNDAAQCEDPEGLGGLPCTRCPSDDLLGLENACSSASCTPFPLAQRLPNYDADAGLPPPLEPVLEDDAGIDAGTSPDAGADAGGIRCRDVPALGSAVYVTGSTAARPFFELLGPQLAVQGISLVYVPSGSCSGVDAILNGRRLTTGAAPLPSAATYWPDANSTGETCQLRGEVRADLGISDVFAQTCPGFELVNVDALRVRDTHGPVQTMTFVVPASSAQTEISAEAAYMAFGFGAAGGVLDGNGNPLWNDDTLLLQRNAQSGTQALLAAAIGLPPGAWKGKPHSSSDSLADDMLAAADDPDQASQVLGILSADYLQVRDLRAQIRPLAFQDAKQACAMYPDSSLTAHDKQNVRDGHYPLWGPLHLLHRVDGSGRPSGPTGDALASILGYLSGTLALPNGVQLIDLYAESGLIPECAMHVQRSRDGGTISRVEPALPCSCLFEQKATGQTACATCRVQGDCARGESCALGYCEPTAAEAPLSPAANEPSVR